MSIRGYIYWIIIISLSIIFLLHFFKTQAHAGTKFTTLKDTVEIVDMDFWVKQRDAALEYERKMGAMVFNHSEVIK